MHVFYVLGGPIFSQCSPVGRPLTIQCDTWSIIYVRQTLFSEYYGVPNDDCQLPAYSSLCHAFSNTSDFYYNGKYRAEHTFVSERLADLGPVLGVNCNHSSTARVVQILYECLTELERSSICEDMTDSGKAVGMLFNPRFPDPVRQQYGDCSCRISATDWGVVRLHAIIINPVHPNTGSGRWSLNVRINDEKVYSLDQMYRLSADIGIPDSNSLVLEYSNGGDTTYLPVMVPRVPTGFWIRYSAFPATSRLDVTCSHRQDKGTQLSSGLLAVIGCIAGLSGLILLVITGLFIRRILSRRKHVPGRHNQLVGSSQRSAAFSELNKEFHFLRRCNTLSTLSRYNSLPSNFVFKNKIRKLSSVKSQDSGIAVIDIHRNESFKHAVSSVNADDCVENETKPENEANLNEKSPEQEATSMSEAEKTEQIGITGIPELGVFEFLPVFGATDDEVDV
ncbi:uncharacterized protein LOC111114648 [Crassostrea virginica]